MNKRLELANPNHNHKIYTVEDITTPKLSPKYRKAKVCPIQGCYKTVKKLSQHIHVANPRLSKEQRLQCTKLAKEERTKKQQFPRIKGQSSITSFTREKTQPQQNPWSEVTSGTTKRFPFF